MRKTTYIYTPEKEIMHTYTQVHTHILQPHIHRQIHVLLKTLLVVLVIEVVASLALPASTNPHVLFTHVRHRSRHGHPSKSLETGVDG